MHKFKQAYLARKEWQAERRRHTSARNGHKVSDHELLAVHEGCHACVGLAITGSVASVDIDRFKGGVVSVFDLEKASDAAQAAFYLAGHAGERYYYPNEARDAGEAKALSPDQEDDITQAEFSLDFVCRKNGYGGRGVYTKSASGYPVPNLYVVDMVIETLSQHLFADAEFRAATERVKQLFAGTRLGGASGLEVKNVVRWMVHDFDAFCKRVKTIAEVTVKATLKAA